MNCRTKCMGVTLVALLLGGCETCQQMRRITHPAPDPEIPRDSGRGRPVEPQPIPLAKSAQGETPGNALSQFVSNKFEGPWTVSRILIGPERMAFGEGDRVRVRANPDGPMMTVEYVPHPTYIDSRYYTGSEEFTLEYRCRWKNKDGSESTGGFQEKELEPAG
ncbi:MAG: hypothetical protein K8U57_15885 [Planctomycetes bacterium]|nr:hypothetical protein [Planctomycetota bacterium]